MKIVRSASGLLALVCAGLLTSCIDSHEEFWIQSNGSGRAEITYSVPVAVARMNGNDAEIREMIAGFLKHSPTVTSSQIEVFSSDASTRVTIKASFDSALDLGTAASEPSLKHLPPGANHLVGTIQSRVQGRTLDFTRTVSPGKALIGSVFMPASRFEGHRMVYILHLPAAASESNATRVTDSGRTLTWDIPLSHALQSPIVTHFKVDLPLPWKIISAVAVPLAALCGLLVVRAGKSRIRSKTGRNSRPENRSGLNAECPLE